MRALHLIFVVASLQYVSALSVEPHPEPVEQFPLPLELRWDSENPWRVEGRVVSNENAAIPNAHVALIADLYTMDAPRLAPQVLSQVRTNEAGKFHITTPSLDWSQCRDLTVMASAPNHAVSSIALDVASLKHPPVDFRLEPADDVQGRLLDPTGKPAASVRLCIRTISEEVSPSTPYASSVTSWPSETRPQAWPAPVVTDEEGRFVLRCLRLRPSAKVRIVVEADDARYASESIFAMVDATRRELALQCQPACVVTGRVICQDSGEPMPNTWLLVVSNPHNFSRGADTQFQGVQARTDDRGRFTAKVKQGKFVTVFVYPSAGQPYPAWMEQQPWPDEVAQGEVNVKVPRGVLVRGRVIDEQTRAAVAGAGVEYQPHFDFDNPQYPGHNPFVSKEVCRQVYWAAERRRAVTDRDGRFQIGVLPGKGNLLVKASTRDYISRAVTLGELQWEQRAAFYFCMEGLRTLNPKPESQPLEEEITLRRGAVLGGTVVGPQGERVDKAVLLVPSYSALYINPPNVLPQPVRNGLWQLRGYDWDNPQLISIFDSQNEWGATAMFSKDDTPPRGPEIRLQPCGTASVKFVDQDQRPWVDIPLLGDKQPLGLLMVEGLPAAPQDDYILSGSSGDIGWLMHELAPQRYRNLRTDNNGRISLPCLIPGARYKLFRYAFGDGRQLWRESKVFQVEPGQQLDLGVVVARRSG
jgi:hypothetical protein